jgi:RNA-directed DNA polymerase
MPGTPSPESISTKLERIATLVRHRPALVLTSLAHHIDVAFLRDAYRRTRKDGAVGVDGQTAAANLDANLQGLRDRLKAGTYKAPPVRRVHIAKAETGRTRPIGIPTFADKIRQRAVAMILEAICEQDFLPCSYGFRPGARRPTARSSGMRTTS